MHAQGRRPAQRDPYTTLSPDDYRLTEQGAASDGGSSFQPHHGKRGVIPSRDFYNELTRRGAFPAAAAGLAGNAAYESGSGSWHRIALDPATDAGRKNWGTGDAAVGSMQWEGARKRGVGPSVGSQAQRIIDELKRGGGTTGGLTLGQLNAIKDPRKAAAIVNRRYERPLHPGASMAARQNYAQRAYQAYGAGTPSAPGAPPSISLGGVAPPASASASTQCRRL